MTEPTKSECSIAWKGLEGALKHAKDIIRRKKISIENRDKVIEQLRATLDDYKHRVEHLEDDLAACGEAKVAAEAFCEFCNNMDSFNEHPLLKAWLKTQAELGRCNERETE